jgi:PAS domain S-box-containing protein
MWSSQPCRADDAGFACRSADHLRDRARHFCHPGIKSGMDDQDEARVDRLLDTPELADALESDRFKQFLDRVPIAIAVAELKPREHIIYVNLECERMTGRTASELEGRHWHDLSGQAAAPEDDRVLSDAIIDDQEYIGIFSLERSDGKCDAHVWSNVIEDDHGEPAFRLIALADASQESVDRDALERRIEERDLLLRELQHRVKNNLQMITALIRLEARNLPEDEEQEGRFDRLAGRVQALALLYDAMSAGHVDDGIDLGIYLSQIASAVMRAHGVEGIRLDLKVDTWPVSVNVAMPAGLVVNELLTNALKHAFPDGRGGTIRLHSLVDETGCRVVVADDGVGLGEGAQWPKPGKLGAMIVQSLRQNARADLDVESKPDEGMRVTITFRRADAAPASSD